MTTCIVYNNYYYYCESLPGIQLVTALKKLEFYVAIFVSCLHVLLQYCTIIWVLCDNA